MRKLLIAGVLATALAFTVSASAALVPGVLDPGNTGLSRRRSARRRRRCTWRRTARPHERCRRRRHHRFERPDVPVGVVHVRERVPVPGWLASVQRGYPAGFFFLGCNNVTPTTNANGTATYTFTAQTLRQPASGSDADRHDPVRRGAHRRPGHRRPDEDHVQRQAAEARTWQSRHRPRVQEGRLEELLEPAFKNQGQCVKYLVHGRNAANKSA